MKRTLLALVPASLAMFCNCSHRTAGDKGFEPAPLAATRYVRPVGTGAALAIPKATAFKIDPKYADHVAITLNSDGTITYFPAPTDITPDSAPVPLGDGWYLNRQGISSNSVFTNWTFAQYAALKQVPTIAELKQNIIPGARVETFATLPCNVNEAPSKLEMIRKALGISQ